MRTPVFFSCSASFCRYQAMSGTSPCALRSGFERKPLVVILRAVEVLPPAVRRRARDDRVGIGLADRGAERDRLLEQLVVRERVRVHVAVRGRPEARLVVEDLLVDELLAELLLVRRGSSSTKSPTSSGVHGHARARRLLRRDRAVLPSGFLPLPKSGWSGSVFSCGPKTETGNDAARRVLRDPAHDRHGDRGEAALLRDLAEEDLVRVDLDVLPEPVVRACSRRRACGCSGSSCCRPSGAPSRRCPCRCRPTRCRRSSGSPAGQGSCTRRPWASWRRRSCRRSASGRPPWSRAPR